MLWAWDQTGLAPGDKLLLIALADGGDPGGEAPPLVGPAVGADLVALAERCCMTPTDLTDALVRLSTAGLVSLDGSLT